MELRTYIAGWGMTEPLPVLFAKAAEAGYRGFEALAPSGGEEAQLRSLLAEYRFDFIAQIQTAAADPIADFREKAKRAAEFGPRLIVSQSFRHGLSPDENRRFFEQALAIERELGVPVAHETHRGRAMYAPWTTAGLLREFPELRIAADFSHWCCVCENLLEDQAEHLDVAMSRTIHIHGRVGHREGPQVSDPSAPEYAEELQAHLGWWTEIARRRRAEGAPLFTFTPEFGPPGYMPTLPHTRQPIADLWSVRLWMNRRFEQSFAEL
ncbi:sugar phosphate isomerase/epimerase family protein [Paenibacillus flagellatus]|uniref:Xylose isomerase n=1 Tax=Paenibacillus flagellatus TaxID=2211139 RepID=A0A2V5KC79_9BACL|nr:TIM barrel protein [Paenibacillus flagellatus]PYI56602.1 xylose isomerase [Paenibacillus flagellatus]